MPESPSLKEQREILTMDQSMTSAEAAELNTLLDEAEAEDAANAKPDPGLSNSEDQAPPEEDPDAPKEGEDTQTEGKPDAPLAPKEGEDDGKPKEGDEPPEKPPEDPDPKAAKEAARRDKSWKALNDEKEQVKAEREQIQRERAEIARIRAEQSTPKYTADDYDRAAEEFETRGQYETAELARKEAQRMRSNPGENRAAAAHQGRAQAEAQQMASWDRAKIEFPEIIDKNNPLNRELVGFLNENPRYLEFPNGPYLAAQFVSNRIGASRVSGLSQENESLKARVKELEQATSIPRSGDPFRARGEKSFHEMSLKEQEAALDREFAEA